jgi:hypothetical protein
VNALHQELWAMPSSRLHWWWQSAISHYGLLAQSPLTPFSATAPASTARV